MEYNCQKDSSFELPIEESSMLVEAHKLTHTALVRVDAVYDQCDDQGSH